MNNIIVSVDVDNTIFYEVYPGIGELIPGAKETINWLYDLGHTVIINTCREKEHADIAKEQMQVHGIKWHYFNVNDPHRIDRYGHDSRKIGCDILIDDRDISVKANGGVVDWLQTRRRLERVLLPKKKIVCIVGESG